MAPYRITLYDAQGGVHGELVMDFEHDDAAIDRIGDLEHPHAMDVWQEDRHVARFPPARSAGGRPGVLPSD